MKPCRVMSDRRKEHDRTAGAEGTDDELGEEAEGGDEAEVVEPEVVDDDSAAADVFEDDEEEEEASGSLVRFDPLQRYMAEARRYPLLSREEEKELAIRFVHAGDVDAAYRLVTANSAPGGHGGARVREARAATCSTSCRRATSA
jgi:DNA-directed RNA polymerase sigma subunit (sigma70/sigma32)